MPAVISRRGFLRLAATGAAASWTARPGTAALQQPSASSLPPSIAALKPLTDRAQPISVGERERRIERARQLMREQRIDAVLLTGGTSLTYFTGARWGNSERLMALVLPARGDAFAVIPAFEEERVREQLPPELLGNLQIRVWQETESPFTLVAQGLKDRSLAAGSLGFEETTRFVFTDGIARAVPALRVTSATPVTAGCRMVKDAHELSLMRLASQVTLKCYEAVFRALTPGMSVSAASRLIGAAYTQLGFPGEATIQVGEYTALPHGSALPQTIREDAVVMIDDGCIVHGYQSDLTRTFALGNATDKMKRVFDIVHRAQTAALKAARPGVPLEQIDAAARKVIVEAGYGPGFTYFTHRLGHGIGMDMHEWPYLVGNNMFGWERNLTAKAGMTFSDEPGIYLRGEFGIRLEDDMVITETGAELFTPQSPSIESPFG
jgi:Xaa-Pro dipeptidase